MEIPSLGVQLDLQLLAYFTVTATWDPSHICELHHSSWQCQILNPLSKARDQTCNLMVPSHICFPPCHDGNSSISFLKIYIKFFLGGVFDALSGCVSLSSSLSPMDKDMCGEFSLVCF